MNEAEKSKRIAKLIYPDAMDYKTYEGCSGVGVVEYDPDFDDIMTVVDYCNNWNDLMPLVVEHGIVLDRYYEEGDWIGHYPFGRYESIRCENTNPQHALADCLLKVLEEKGDAT